MASMAQQLAAQGLAFERVEAVVGRELTLEQWRALYSPVWFFLLHGRRATPNELGCTLSHRKAWQIMLERGQEWAVFFEDDAELSRDFGTQLDRYNMATKDFELVQFHSFRIPDVKIEGGQHEQFEVKKFSGTNASAVAYILRLSGARKLLKNSRAKMNADKWVWARALFGLKSCAIYPFPVRPHGELSALSTIGNSQWGSRSNYFLWRVLALPPLRLARVILLKMRNV